ncbi:MAG TPA: GH116 family glycosyl hydrolase, partial [Puia sp.]
RLDELHRAALQWQSTWYDSTLPHWFLERTIINTGTVATANTYRFADGRFWGWEGVNACEGTCTHVWQYAQALGRLFPELERDTRERVDLGIAMMDDGGILFRGEFETRPAIDGQAGTILRIYREHQLSPDDAFLRRNWPRIKKAVEFMLRQDKNGDGLTDTPMENTLDAVWEGEIAWIAGLCIAAAKAACQMATEAGDAGFAAVCSDYVEKGSANMTAKLFNGEYFIHRPDSKKGRAALGSYNTCHIDQVYGQSWAHQVGLGELWDGDKTRSALRALWKYNFTKDVGPYIATHVGGRPYALAGEGGMIMNTNPSNEPKPYGENETWQLGYFHECMSGFEHQVAAHMMAEGMTDESLVLIRMIHERYHGAKRNPYNEIECSDHYARAMASYGSFISACGFTYHGPGLSIGFDPRLSPDHFRAPFTVAEGWGTYEQERKTGAFTASYRLGYGRLALQHMRFRLSDAHAPHGLAVRKNGVPLAAEFKKQSGYVDVSLAAPVMLIADDKLSITM